MSREYDPKSGEWPWTPPVEDPRLIPVERDDREQEDLFILDLDLTKLTRPRRRRTDVIEA